MKFRLSSFQNGGSIFYKNYKISLFLSSLSCFSHSDQNSSSSPFFRSLISPPRDYYFQIWQKERSLLPPLHLLMSNMARFLVVLCGLENDGDIGQPRGREWEQPQGERQGRRAQHLHLRQRFFIAFQFFLFLSFFSCIIF